MNDPTLLPVLMGSDAGVYALARSFHEEYGVTSVVVSNSGRGPILNSSIIDVRLAGSGATAERTVEVLLDVAQSYPDHTLILVGNAEHEVDLIETHWDTLARHYLLPYPPPEVLHRVRDKRTLAEMAARVGLRTPITHELSPRDCESVDRIDVRYPVILKPAESGEFSLLSFPGKQKVYLVGNATDLASKLAAIEQAGYTGAMLVQEYISGGDPANVNVTVYRGADGTIAIADASRMLLGQQTPNVRGVAAAMLAGTDPDLRAKVSELVQALDYRGFANVDIKIHEISGDPYVLDFNTRVGRSHYQLRLRGFSVARALVQDYVLGGPVSTQIPAHQGVYSMIPTWWLRRYLVESPWREQALAARRRQKLNPNGLVYRADRNPRRWAYRIAAELNLVKSLYQNYPKPTATGFKET